MEIYAEYFFIENLIANIMILLLTAKIWGLSVPKDRLLIGAIAATIYAFGIFTPISIFLFHPISKIIFSCLMMKTVFWDVRGILAVKLVATFFGATILLGGAVTALLYITGIGGTVSSSAFYVEKNSYFSIICCLAAGYCFIRLFLNILKERKMNERVMVDVTVKVGEKEKSLKGIVDTGNFLSDPESGLPVMIGEADAVRELLPTDFEQGRIRLIPYSSIGKENGALLGVKAEFIDIRQDGKYHRTTAGVLAVYQGKLSQDGEYQVIVHPGMLEKGAECSA